MIPALLAFVQLRCFWQFNLKDLKKIKDLKKSVSGIVIHFQEHLDYGGVYNLIKGILYFYLANTSNCPMLKDSKLLNFINFVQV